METSTFLIDSPHADRLGVWLGQAAGGQVAVLGPMGARLLRGLIGHTRGIIHLGRPPHETAALAELAAALGFAEFYASCPEAAQLTDRPAVGTLLVVAPSTEAAAATVEATGPWADTTRIVALVGADTAPPTEVPSPDPQQAIVLLRRQPPAVGAPCRSPLPVTVVVPTYNRPAMLVEAVASALALDPPAAEILVADDGSDAATATALKPFAGRIRHLELPHRNMAAAMNAGLAASTTPWIAWLDDDDLFLPAKLGIQFDQTQRAGAGFSATAHVIADQRRHPRDVIFLPEFKRGAELRLLLRGSIFLGPTTLVHQDAYAQAATQPGAPPNGGPYDQSLERAADYAMWLKLARVATAHAVQVPLSIIRRHPGNTLTETRARQIFASIQASVAWLRDHVGLEELVADPRLALMDRARASIRAGLAAGARRDLEAARQAGVSPVRVDCLLGLVQLEAAKTGPARDYFERALAAAGTDLEALNGLGTAHWLAGNDGDARKAFQQAVDHAPRDPLSLYNLSCVDEPGATSAQALARLLFEAQQHRSALYSPRPPLAGIDQFFAGFRRQGWAR